MSRKEIVLLVSRAFALLLISWAFVEVTYLPERLFALSHHLNQSSVSVANDYWSRYYSDNHPLSCSADACIVRGRSSVLELRTTGGSTLLAAAGKPRPVRVGVRCQVAKHSL
jgi:hypothetical protein